MKVVLAPDTIIFANLPTGEVFTERHDPDTPYIKIEYVGCDECTELNAVNLLNGDTAWISGNEEVVPHPLSEFVLR